LIETIVDPPEFSRTKPLTLCVPLMLFSSYSKTKAHSQGCSSFKRTCRAFHVSIRQRDIFLSLFFTPVKLLRKRNDPEDFENKPFPLTTH
jgi:hypothetical protein